MKAKEINNMSVEDLKKKYADLRRDLMKENAQIATGTNPKNPGQIRQMKKNIARILCAQHSKRKTK